MLTFYSEQTARVDELAHTYLSIKSTNTQCIYYLHPYLHSKEVGCLQIAKEYVLDIQQMWPDFLE